VNVSRLKRVDEDDEAQDEAEKSTWVDMGQKVYGLGVPTFGPKLPPGIYAAQTNQNGEARLKSIPPRTDPIFEVGDKLKYVMSDVVRFWGKQEAYAEAKVPYRRGMLLYGPPGCGKSSVIRLALEDVVRRNGIGLLIKGNFSAFISCFNAIKDMQPETSMLVVLEDIDRDVHPDIWIINVLDGVDSVLENVYFIATTNYLQNVSARLQDRPGRFDRRVEMAPPSMTCRQAYIEALIGGAYVDLNIKKMVKDTNGMSFAHIKELFTAVALLGEDYTEVLTHLPKATNGG
jgi:hypothetical protein